MLTALFAPTDISHDPYRIESEVFRMVRLAGAEAFEMGNNEGEEDSYDRERPRHTRKIDPFALGEYPVTQALWASVLLAARKRNITYDPEKLPDHPAYFWGSRRPVETVNWYQVRDWCKVLNQVLGLPPDHFRLPSEAEWEYAARAGSRDFPYAGSARLKEAGWYDENNGRETLPVGWLAPNAWGLYDMSGNVWEWCEDDWHDNYDGHPSDGRAWIDGPERAAFRVYRGGGRSNAAWYCRSAFRDRDWFGPDYRDYRLGFRLAAPSSGTPLAAEPRGPAA